MTPFITEFVFVCIIAIMLLLLAGFQAIARNNYNKRLNRKIATSLSATKTGAKIIALPQNAMKPSKERIIVKKTISEEEIV